MKRDEILERYAEGQRCFGYTDLNYDNLRGADLSGAGLSGADLSGADLSGASLWNCVGNMREIKNIMVDTWAISYTKDVIQIGCKNHTIEEWKNFTAAEIDEMDDDALAWWRKYKDLIFKTIELSPCR